MVNLDKAIRETAYILETLVAYRNIVESGSCNECGARNNCKYVPKLGEQVRYNCPFYKEKETR